MTKFSLFFKAVKSTCQTAVATATPVVAELFKNPIDKEIALFQKQNPGVPYEVKFLNHSLRPGLIHQVPYVVAAEKRQKMKPHR